MGTPPSGASCSGGTHVARRTAETPRSQSGPCPSQVACISLPRAREVAMKRVANLVSGDEGVVKWDAGVGLTPRSGHPSHTPSRRSEWHR